MTNTRKQLIKVPPMATQKPFRPYGVALDLMLSREPEILIEGPAGTGKSRVALEKLHLVAQNYPGMRGLIARKTRKSITQSTKVTFESKVLTEHERPHFHGMDQEYRYSNGSRIIVAGLNDPERIKSSEYDFIYVNEGTEATAEEYEILTTRNRNGVMPYQQIVVDANPDAPKHWLNQRAERGAMLRLLSKHEDNPSITPEYLAKLDLLTGVRYKRLRLGLWVAAEGMVFEEWDHSRHVIPPFAIPAKWRRFISVDFGYTNPFVAQWWAQNPFDGSLVMYREIYHTKRMVQDHAHQMFALSSRESIESVITDHDAEDRATLEAHWHRSDECGAKYNSQSSIPTTAADKEVSTGIEAVKARLLVDGVAVMADCLVELDEDLKDSGRPTCTVDEVDGYIWKEQDSEKLGLIHHEEPLKKDDHGMDSLRYLVKHVDSGRAEAWSSLFKNPSTIHVTSNDETSDNIEAWQRMFSQH